MDAPAGHFLSRDFADGVQDTLMELGAGLREVPARLYVLSPAPIATTSHQASTGVVCTGSKGQKVLFNTLNIVASLFFNFICYWVGKQKTSNLLEDSATGGAAAFSSYQVHPHVAAIGVL